MSVTSGLPPRRRLILGVCMLIIVNAMWVISAEVTRMIFRDFVGHKPFFSTYFKTSLFMLYLVGFMFWRPWRRQCLDCFNKPRSLPFSTSDSSDDESIPEIPPTEPLLSDPLYVPVKFNESDKEEGSFSDSERNDESHVHFNNLMEVRHLAEAYADEAALARMSFDATEVAKQSMIEANKFTVSDVAKIGFMFCMVWFLANFSYQEALDHSDKVIVSSTLSSTSSLFVLFLAGVFPSSSGDKFTLTKLVAVLFCMAGVFLVSFSRDWSSSDLETECLWALGSAVFYSVYLVMLRRKVDNEDKLDIPMFFGFVGLFNFILIWPGIFVLHYSAFETFEFPSWKVWAYLFINGLVGTVLSEVLWLWGCFLTSSLIATLSWSITIPLTMLADLYFNKGYMNLLFYIGCGPIIISFIVVSVLKYYNDWDPVWLAVKFLLNSVQKLASCICIKQSRRRSQEDCEQTERLISMSNLGEDCDNEEGC